MASIRALLSSSSLRRCMFSRSCRASLKDCKKVSKIPKNSSGCILPSSSPKCFSDLVNCTGTKFICFKKWCLQIFWQLSRADPLSTTTCFSRYVCLDTNGMHLVTRNESTKQSNSAFSVLKARWKYYQYTICVMLFWYDRVIAQNFLQDTKFQLIFLIWCVSGTVKYSTVFTQFKSELRQVCNRFCYVCNSCTLRWGIAGIAMLPIESNNWLKQKSSCGIHNLWEHCPFHNSYFKKCLV